MKNGDPHEPKHEDIEANRKPLNSNGAVTSPSLVRSLRNLAHEAYIWKTALGILGILMYGAYQSVIAVSAKISALSVHLRPTDLMAIVGIAGFIACVLALFGVSICTGYFAWTIWRSNPQHKDGRLTSVDSTDVTSQVSVGMIGLCKSFLSKSYNTRRFDYFHLLQFWTRLSACFLIIGSGLIGILQRFVSESIHSTYLNRTLNSVHVIVGVAYLFISIYHLATGRPHLAEILKSLRNTSSVTEIKLFEENLAEFFWKSAKWDYALISVVWLTTLLPDRPFHLAFIIPLMATWLFTMGRSEKMLKLVIATLVARSIIIGLLVSWSAEIAAKVGYIEFGVAVIPASLFSELAFWITLAAVLAMFRHVRQALKDRAGELDAAYKAEAKARSEAERLQKDAECDHHRERDARLNEEFLRYALENLSAARGDAVFVKDQGRRFVFANIVLLRMLAPVVRNKSLPFKIENEGTNEEYVRWSDIQYKTDDDLGIDLEEYRNSDRQILNGEIEHYSKYEQTFLPTAPIGTMLWTTKEPIRTANGEIAGLVGCVVPGLPKEMQEMSEYLVQSLPVYASMKDKDGYIVWANDNHLAMLATRIDELLIEQGLTHLTTTNDTRAKLRAINNGRGPTDKDLYGESGEKYAQRDAKIMSIAKTHRGTVVEFDSKMESFIREEFPTQERDEVFPIKGWIENHRFPRTDHGQWVEVWKMPWWKNKIQRGVTSRCVNGILVFFRDHHKTYLRKSVIWRWLDRHFSLIFEGTARILKHKKEHATARAMRVPMIMRRLLHWVRDFVDKAESRLPLSNTQRKLAELTSLLEIVENCYHERVKVHCVLDDASLLIRTGADELFGIVIVLVMNAIEATISQSDGGELAPVLVKITSSQQRFLDISIEDQAGIFDENQAAKINRLEGLHREDGKPGGGFFVAKSLAVHMVRLCGEEDATELARSCIQIKPGAHGFGAHVFVQLPLSALHAVSSLGKHDEFQKPRESR